MEVAAEWGPGALLKPTQGQFETFSTRSRGYLGKEAAPSRANPSPGSRSMAARHGERLPCRPVPLMRPRAPLFHSLSLSLVGRMSDVGLVAIGIRRGDLFFHRRNLGYGERDREKIFRLRTRFTSSLHRDFGRYDDGHSRNVVLIMSISYRR